MAPPRHAEHRAAANRGFTLLEVLLALAIVAVVMAVAVPQLAHRLDGAYADAELAQAGSSARGLPARLALLGVEVRLDDAALAKALPDGRPPLDLPQRWQVKVEKAPVFGRAGSCEPGTLMLTEPSTGRRWRVAFARVSCAVTVTVLDAQAT
jgi:prepilin-type N-terminal cleavage/methylation domain-containing protein